MSESDHNPPVWDALVEPVVARCQAKLGQPESWRNPSGYPDGLALCIVDAIWSLGANYDAHVVPVLDAYREIRRTAGGNPNTDGTPELIDAIASCGGGTGFADAVRNHQRTSARKTAPLKAEAVDQAAGALNAEAITTADAFRAAVAADATKVAHVWRSVPGQRSSDIGWRYLLLLSGADEVKPDRMVSAFLRDCGVPALPTRDAVALVRSAATRLEVPARVLDHAIWLYQRAL